VDCEGIADVLDVVRRADQALITVIDIKASRRNSVSFLSPRLPYAFDCSRTPCARAAYRLRRGAILGRQRPGWLPHWSL
jgi:hypothetical protein